MSLYLVKNVLEFFNFEFTTLATHRVIALSHVLNETFGLNFFNRKIYMKMQERGNFVLNKKKYKINKTNMQNKFFFFRNRIK